MRPEEPSRRNVVGILLAAGASTRFGGDKLTQLLPDGTPIAVAAARNLRPACEHCVAVVRPSQWELAALLAAEDFEIVACADAADGMGRSLAAAVNAAADADGWLVALADMPLIQPRTIVAVANVLRNGACLAAPTFKGRRGHPAGFSRQWKKGLLALQGDQGARDIIRANEVLITTIDCDEPGVLVDIDTPEALQRIADRVAVA